MEYVVVYSEEAEPFLKKTIGPGLEKLDERKLLRRDELDIHKMDVDAVVVIGGDGTLFYSTHYLSKGYIIGLHTGKQNSIGHFIKTKTFEEVEMVLARLNKGDATGFEQFQRLKASIVTATGRKYNIDKAFNDYAIGNSKFGLPSKYYISTDDMDEPEFQRSSGIVVPTIQGMTGWAKNIIPEQFGTIYDEYKSKTNGEFPFFIREPMGDYRNVTGFTTKLTISSDIHRGIIAVDGFRDLPIERGDKIIIERSKNPLWLYVGNGV